MESSADDIKAYAQLETLLQRNFNINAEELGINELHDLINAWLDLEIEDVDEDFLKTIDEEIKK